MPRFFGKVGYGESVEVDKGVFEDQISEISYYGDVTQITRYSSVGDTVLPETTFQTTISVVADAYALKNFTNIRYVEWAGSLWTVSSVRVERPRLILAIGEVYNGPRPSA